MAPVPWQKPLALVTGKGGSGKSLLSAIYAILAAREGRKVLVCEAGAVSQVAPLFGVRLPLHEEVWLAPGIHGINIVPEFCFEEYVSKHLKMKKLYDTALRHPLVQTFLGAMPGLKETMLLGRLMHSLEVQQKYDTVIFDAPATGHFLGLMSTPDAILKTGLTGPLMNEVSRVKALFASHEKTGVSVVTLAEELILSETFELLPKIKESFLALDAVILNRAVSPVEVEGLAADLRYARTKDIFEKRLECQASLFEKLGSNLPVYSLPEFGAIAEPWDDVYANALVRLHRPEPIAVANTANTAAAERSTPSHKGPHANTDEALAERLRQKKVLMLLGAGGVGKTTTSIALAFRAADLGLRVGLLSIDPARRLATALGLELSQMPKPIHRAKGVIEAAMIDQGLIFDAMVAKHTSADKAKQILANPIYRAIRSGLAGPLEYMALTQMNDMVTSGRYDIVLVDTPPDTHALDFLSRPDILAKFREQKVMRWLVKPFNLAKSLGNFLNIGDRLMGGLSRITGFSALGMVSEFLILIQSVIDGFHKNSDNIKAILEAETTDFFLVSAPSSSSQRSSLFLLRELEARGYALGGIVMNRLLERGAGDSHSLLGDKLELRYAEEQRLCTSLAAEVGDIKLWLYAHEAHLPIDSIDAIERLASNFQQGGF